MNKILVTCLVDLQPENIVTDVKQPKGKLVVKNDRIYPDRVILNLGGTDFIVNADELRMAVTNALNAH